MRILFCRFHIIYACGKSFLDYTNFFPNHYKKKDNIIYKYFKSNNDRRFKAGFYTHKKKNIIKKIDETRKTIFWKK